MTDLGKSGDVTDIVMAWDVQDGGMLGATVVCKACGGLGRIVQQVCVECSGSGQMHRPYSLLGDYPPTATISVQQATPSEGEDEAE